MKRLLIALLCAAIGTGAFAQLSPTIPTSTVQAWSFRESAVAPPLSTSGYAKLYVDTSGDAWYSKNGGAFTKLPFAASTFVASFNGRTGAVVPTSGDYGVAQVTGAAPIASPTFTGTVTLPSPFTLGATSVTVTGTEINRLAGVTSAVQTQLDGKAALSHTHAESDVTSLVSDLAAKAPLLSPTFTGTPAAPTAALNTNTTQLATTAFVRSQITADAPVASVFAQGGTNADLSATGGTHFFLKQNAVGAAITSVQPAAADLSDGTTGSGGAVVLATAPTVDSPNVNTLMNLGAFRRDLAWPSCCDARDGRGRRSITGCAERRRAERFHRNVEHRRRESDDQRIAGNRNGRRRLNRLQGGWSWQFRHGAERAQYSPDAEGQRHGRIIDAGCAVR
jgi:hypothetical protein